MAEAAAVASGLMEDPYETEGGDHLSSMRTPAPRESTHGFTRGPSFDLEYTEPATAHSSPSKRISLTMGGVTVTSDDANATDGATRMMRMHGDGHAVSDIKYRHARASRLSLQQKIGIPTDLGDELTNNLSKAAQDLHRKSRLSVTKSGVPRVSLQARTPQLAHEVYTKTREVTQDEGELEGKLPMRRLSFPSVLNNDELRPDEIDSLITLAVKRAEEESQRRQEKEDALVAARHAEQDGGQSSDGHLEQATSTASTVGEVSARGDGSPVGEADGGTDGASAPRAAVGSPKPAARMLTPVQPKLPKAQWWHEPQPTMLGEARTGSAIQPGESSVASVQSSAARKRRWSFATMRPSAVEEEAGLYPHTMFDELREFYDPLYRLLVLRKHMHARFHDLWGAYHGAEVKYWRRMQEVVELFRSVDLDGDGTLNRAELIESFKTFGVHARIADCDYLMSMLDKDHNGQVNITEFGEWYLDSSEEWRAQRRRDNSDDCNDVRVLQRESLRFDADVRGLIDVYWHVVNFDELEWDDDKKGSPSSWLLTKDEYLEFNMNLQHHISINVNGEKEKDFDEAVALDTAAQEWEFDAGGKSTMAYPVFVLALFQMADAWAEEISSEAYCDFLTGLLADTTEMKELSDGTMARCWKWQSKKHIAEVEEREAILMKQGGGRLRSSRAGKTKRPASSEGSKSRRTTSTTLPKAQDKEKAKEEIQAQLSQKKADRRTTLSGNVNPSPRPSSRDERRPRPRSPSKSPEVGRAPVLPRDGEASNQTASGEAVPSGSRRTPASTAAEQVRSKPSSSDGEPIADGNVRGTSSAAGAPHATSPEVASRAGADGESEEAEVGEEPQNTQGDPTTLGLLSMIGGTPATVPGEEVPRDSTRVGPWEESSAPVTGAASNKAVEARAGAGAHLETLKSVDTQQAVSQAVSTSDANLLQKLEERGNGGAVLTPKNGDSHVSTPKSVAGETGDQTAVYTNGANAVPAHVMGHPHSPSGMSSEGEEPAHHWMASPQVPPPSFQQAPVTLGKSTLKQSASAPAISSMLQEERAGRTGGLRPSTAAPPGTTTAATAAATTGGGRLGAGQRHERSRETMVKRMPEVAHKVPGTERVDTVAARAHPAASSATDLAAYDRSSGSQAKTSPIDDDKQARIEQQLPQKQDNDISLPLLNTDNDEPKTPMDTHNGPAYQRRPLVDYSSLAGQSANRSLATYSFESGATPASGLQSPEKFFYNRQAGTGKVTRILRASFAAGEQLNDSRMEEFIGRGSYQRETRTFGSGWGPDFSNMAGDNTTFESGFESQRLTIERWMAEEGMHGVPLRGATGVRDPFNAPAQRPGTSSGRIHSRGFIPLDRSSMDRSSRDTLVSSGARSPSPSPTRGLPNMKDLSRPVTPSAPRIVRPSRDKWPSAEYKPRPRSPGPRNPTGRFTLPSPAGARTSSSPPMGQKLGDASGQL